MVHWPTPISIPTCYDGNDLDLEIPSTYICPVTSCLMSQPATSKSGQTYEKNALINWVAEHGTDPINRNVRFTVADIVPNLALRELIQQFLDDNEEKMTADFGKKGIKQTRAEPPLKPSAQEVNLARQAERAAGQDGFEQSFDSERLVRNPGFVAPEPEPPREPEAVPLSDCWPLQKSRSDFPTAPFGSFYVLGVNHPKAGDGRWFQFDREDLTEIVGHWNDSEQAEHGKGMLKGGEGALFVLKNNRTGRVTGTMMWGSSDANGGYGCYNPLEYCNADDWREGDLLEVVHFKEPSNFQPVIPVDIHTNETGWNIAGNKIRFGECGLVGGWWKELEATFTLEEDTMVSGLRTDSGPNLPFVVEFKDSRGRGVVNLDFANGADGEVVFNRGAIKCSSVTVRYPDTDMHKTNGLSTYRSGGGIHFDLLEPASGDRAAEQKAKAKARNL